MKSRTSTVTGCGNRSCSCAGETPVVARINDRALFAEGERPNTASLQERAFGELLRQEAVRQGLLPEADGNTAPLLDDSDRRTIEAMVDRAVTSPQPSDEECRRYFEANQHQFTFGQAVHLRHILFAVTPGVNVHALTVRAEKALLELSRKDVAPGRFGELAAELSNCPSSAQGGDLGWVGPDECAPELANELFQQKHSQWGMGVHPRLIHTRFGFHIIDVLGRRKGRQASYEQVAPRIAAQLALQSRARALNQYMALLVGQAHVEGVELDAAHSPLVQ